MQSDGIGRGGGYIPAKSHFAISLGLPARRENTELVADYNQLPLHNH